MLVVLVNVHVKPESIEAFREATIENARNSNKEPGIARFDVIQHNDDPTHFTLIEVYRTSEAPAKHKDTPHYQKWAKTVVDMMAEPRSSLKFTSIYPPD